jgi:phosphatidylglycerophosphate synthase
VAVPVVTWEQYAAEWAGLHGGVDLTQVRPGMRRWLHLGFVVARSLHRARVPAGAVTAVGLLSSVTVVVVVTHGSGGILLAALLVAAAILADTVDGALAVLSGHTTRLGYVYDAVVDRVGEACWLIALWRIGAAGYVVVVAGALAWLHEYVRSRGNAAGMAEITAVTVGERPTRVIVTIAGLALAGFAEAFNPHVAAGIAAFATATWIVFGLIGITQLLAAVHRALAGQSWPTWRPPSAPSATVPAPERPIAPPAAPTSGGWRARGRDRLEPRLGDRTPDSPEPRAAVPDAAVSDAPVSDAPVSDAPVSDAPVPDAPVTGAPVDTGPVDTGPVGSGRARGYGPVGSGPVGRGQDDRDGARDGDVRDSGISDDVSYTAPSADEVAEPSPDIALREPTLDDLLGDAGARVRGAVEKYGRSVTVYRSQAAGTPEVDAANTTADEQSETDTDAGAELGTRSGGDRDVDAGSADVRDVAQLGYLDVDDGGSDTAIEPEARADQDRRADEGPVAREVRRADEDRPSDRPRIVGLSRARFRFGRRPHPDTAKTGAASTGAAKTGAAKTGAEAAGSGAGGGASSGEDHTGNHTGGR